MLIFLLILFVTNKNTFFGLFEIELHKLHVMYLDVLAASRREIIIAITNILKDLCTDFPFVWKAYMLQFS